MGREIRKVPKGWQHPTDENRRFKPIHDEYYLDALNQWIEEHNQWLKGEHPDQLAYESTKKHKFFAQWSEDCPNVDYYRLEKWTEEEACCFQYYETVSEGTPCSPVFETIKDLEDWLVQNEGHSRQAAQKFCEHGSAPSMTINSGIIKTGVDTFY